MSQNSLFDLFSDGIRDYAQNANPRVSEKPVCAFFPLKGKHYSRDLMIVGRATNGWLGEQHKQQGNDGVSANQLKKDSTSKSFLNTIETTSLSEDPMDWVLDTWNGEEYQGYRSAFWRMAKKILLNLKGAVELENWPSHLVWSNLFKIAPFNGGNPGSLMQTAQKNWCHEMLEHELQTFKPRHVLFMTGYEHWSDEFLNNLHFQTTHREKFPYVQEYGVLSLGDGCSAKVVVVPHPQGKPESEIAGQVARAFKHLST